MFRELGSNSQRTTHELTDDIKQKTQELIAAIEVGDIDACRKLLHEGANPKLEPSHLMTDEFAETLLTDEFVEELLDGDGLEILKLLKQRNIDIDKRDDKKNNLLHKLIQVYRKQYSRCTVDDTDTLCDYVEDLIELGINKNQANDNGVQPYHVARLLFLHEDGLNRLLDLLLPEHAANPRQDDELQEALYEHVNYLIEEYLVECLLEPMAVLLAWKKQRRPELSAYAIEMDKMPKALMTIKQYHELNRWRLNKSYRFAISSRVSLDVGESYQHWFAMEIKITGATCEILIIDSSGALYKKEQSDKKLWRPNILEITHHVFSIFNECQIRVFVSYQKIQYDNVNCATFTRDAIAKLATLDDQLREIFHKPHLTKYDYVCHKNHVISKVPYRNGKGDHLGYVFLVDTPLRLQHLMGHAGRMNSIFSSKPTEASAVLTKAPRREGSFTTLQKKVSDQYARVSHPVYGGDKIIETNRRVEQKAEGESEKVRGFLKDNTIPYLVNALRSVTIRGLEDACAFRKREKPTIQPPQEGANASNPIRAKRPGV